MASPARTLTRTILFTDIVDSTPRAQRHGDDAWRRIVEAHRRMLQQEIEEHGGEAVKWGGDGFMAAFPSVADAVRCGIGMQKAARKPPVAEERLPLRVGLEVGEVGEEAGGDYSGTTVVVAERLCKQALGGEILCSALVGGMLSRRQAFEFRSRGPLELKGLDEPVEALEVLYEAGESAVMVSRTPFVGRGAEVARLKSQLRDAVAGRGGMAMLVGEAGIGKTRTAEQFSAEARAAGALVLWGRCFEGDWTPPYGPVAEAISDYARMAPGEVVGHLGAGAAAISRVVPTLSELLGAVPEPPRLEPDEERYRLLDAVAQFFVSVSAVQPMVLVVDDIHWADKGTVAMLRHLARIAPRHRLLILVMFRDAEVGPGHPLAEALQTLFRETSLDRMNLSGLDGDEVGALLAALAEHEIPPEFVETIRAETAGNPFFIREVLLHLIEEGQLRREEGRWISNLGVRELGIPEGVRQVVGRRLSRLSDNANRLLTVAAAFEGKFSFQIASAVAELDEEAALDSVDEALEAHLLRPAGDADTYDFTHALIRHTLYGGMSPARRSRLHRRLAEEMVRRHGERAAEHAAELAYQYHRSASLPGAEAGFDYALAAADRAEAAYAREDATTFLGMALGLIRPDDPRRPRLMARQGVALAWALAWEDALATAREAGRLIAGSEGAEAAAEFLAQAAGTMVRAGNARAAWELARDGLQYAGDRRDATWAELMAHDIQRREADDPSNPGLPLDTPERREVARVLEETGLASRSWMSGVGFVYHSSREEILQRANDPLTLSLWAGEFRGTIDSLRRRARQADERGQLARGAFYWSQLSRCHNALGEMDAAEEARVRARELGAKVEWGSAQTLNLNAMEFERCLVLDEDWRLLVEEPYLRLLLEPSPDSAWAFVGIRCTTGLAYLKLDRRAELRALEPRIMDAVVRGDAWAWNYGPAACVMALLLWEREEKDGAAQVEDNLKRKVIPPDFRCGLLDASHAVARVVALQGRQDEASEWFDRARKKSEEMATRPVRAIIDFDEGLMFLRRGQNDDAARAEARLEAARRQFREIGMTGWLARLERLGEKAPARS